MRRIAALAVALVAVLTNASASPHVRAPRACSYNKPPPLTLTPTRGITGSRVRLSGGCFQRRWDKGYGVFLLHQFFRPRECEIIAGGRFRLRVDRHGQAHGWFVVPASGACLQHSSGRRVTAGVYSLSIGCHAYFRVLRR